MKGDNIPDSDNITRLCHHTTIDGNGKPQASAFFPRQNEQTLSVNWLENLHCSSRDEEIAEIRRVLNTKLTIKAKAKIAVLNVGELCNYVHDESPDQRILAVLHDPDLTTNDPSHSEICNVRPDYELIAEIILDVVRETYPAR